MDFEPVPHLEMEGYRIAPITLIEPGRTRSGDAYLVTPDGMEIDLYWRAGEAEDTAVWRASTVVGGLGVIQVRVRQQVTSESDLGRVLDIAATVALASGGRPPCATLTNPDSD